MSALRRVDDRGVLLQVSRLGSSPELGERPELLQDERVPQDVEALELQPVGNYAVGIRWSDGHDTGIYAFERLRHLCP